MASDPRGAGAPLPLAGIRVIDLSQNLAGPFGTQILADLGADVTKIEPPGGGDAARAWGPPFLHGHSPLFLAANRNKESRVLDLKTPEGKEALREAVRDADIFVQAFRLGVIESLGFGYEAVRELNPGILYLSIRAWGSSGPLADQPGFDPLLQAYSGLLSVTGARDGEPARVGTSIVDLGTGMWSAIGVLAALRQRDRTGEGSHIEVSLLETALTWMNYHIQGVAGGAPAPRPLGTALGMIAPYQGFPTQDGLVMIAAGNDGLFGRLCSALNRPEWATDPRFRTNPDRVAHRDALAAEVAALTGAMGRDALLELLRGAGVPAAPLQTVAEVVDDPQVAATGLVRATPHPDIPGYREVALPIQWDGERAATRRPPPGLPGEAGPSGDHGAAG